MALSPGVDLAQIIDAVSDLPDDWHVIVQPTDQVLLDGGFELRVSGPGFLVISAVNGFDTKDILEKLAAARDYHFPR